MNVSPQPPLGEEPEKETELHNIDKTPEQPAPTSETSSPEDATEQPAPTSTSATHEVGTEYPVTSTEVAEPENSIEQTETSSEEVETENIEEQPKTSAEVSEHEDIAEEPTIHTSADEETTPQPMTFSEPPAEAEDATENTIADDEAIEDDVEDEEDTTTGQTGSGVFVRKGVLIGVISAVVLVALLGTLLFFVTRPKDPPTDWLTSVTPPAGSGSASKILYYLHWTNDNGELKGKLDLAAYANGGPQSVSDDATGLYSRDNHIIYVVIVDNGQPVTFTGKINDSNDTLTLSPAGATGQTTPLVFHTSSADNYKQETKKLVPAKAPTQTPAKAPTQVPAKK